MGQPSDVDTPIYDQLVLEIWPEGLEPQLPSDDPVTQQSQT